MKAKIKTYLAKEHFSQNLIRSNIHSYFNHAFFHYLQSKSLIGISREQYHVFRDNIAMRTSYTISYVAKVIIAAAHECDYETVANYGKNLYEEAGEGNKDYVHLSLFTDCFSFHGIKMFNLPALDIKQINQSKLILPATLKYIQSQEETYQSNDYLRILGASFAQETAAETMLAAFYRGIFFPYIHYYENDEFNKIRRYFDVHLLTGVEHEHGIIAKEAVIRACKSEADMEKVFASALNFAKVQAEIWHELHETMKKYENTDVIPIISREKELPTL